MISFIIGVVWCAVVLVYANLGTTMDIQAAIVMSLVGMPLSPHCDKPYLSASVSEFWSRRWNITVANTLRSLVYDPINEGEIIVAPLLNNNDSYSVSHLSWGVYGADWDELAWFSLSHSIWNMFWKLVKRFFRILQVKSLNSQHLGRMKLRPIDS